MGIRTLGSALVFVTIGLASGGAHAAPRAAKAKVAPAAKVAKVKAAARARPGKVASKPTTKLAASKSLTPAKFLARTTKLAKAYAKEHQLEVRTVKVGPEGKRIARTFVPILPSTFESFQRTFTAPGKNDSVMLRYSPKGMSNAHLVMAVNPGDIYLWAQNKNIGGNGNPFYKNAYMQTKGGTTQWPGYSISVHPTSIKSLKNFLEKEAAQGTFCGGNCMRWLPNAVTGKDRTLFHDLGISRSLDGKNMTAKIVHSGNHRVGVIGVHVENLAQFKAMTDAQLVGGEPKGGVAAAQR